MVLVFLFVDFKEKCKLGITLMIETKPPQDHHGNKKLGI